MALNATPSPTVRLHHRLRVPAGDAWKRLPTVLLVHGLDSASDTFDDGVLDDVGKVYRTVAVDLRGHGRSPFGNGDFSVDANVGDLLAKLEELQVDDVILLGHSMGARVCIPFAVRLGVRCRGLVIEDMDVRPRRARSEILNPAELRRIKDFKSRYGSLPELFDAMERVGYEPERVQVWVQTQGRVWQEDGEYVVGVHPWASLLEVNALLATDEARRDLPKLAPTIARCPVLILQADETAACTDTGVQEMKELLPGIQHVKIAGSTHSIHHSNKQEFLHELHGFLRQCCATATPSPTVRLHHRLRVPAGDDWRRLPTVLLVHGLDSASDTFDNGVLDDVGKVYRTVAVDLRGHGRSPFGNGDFSVDANVGDLLAKLEELQVDDVILLGHSMGARVCIPFAVRLGVRCRGLVIEDMDVWPRERSIISSPALLRHLQTFRGRFGSWAELHKTMSDFGYDDKRIRMWRRQGRAWEENGEWVVGVNPWVSHLEVNALLATDEAQRDLPKLSPTIARCPVLLMEADEYGACSKKGVEQMLQLLPGIQYIKIPGSNHSVHNVTINEFLHVLHEFLRQCCATGAASL